ncbi:MAG: winged helix-turn-helix transcriptional regulator [Acidimicrobiaceae bacterium]|nr:winged helix-turn-helix transcriptional regulator [Acidimicrobiaceae bacterium]
MPRSTLHTPLYVAKAELFKALGHPTRIRILELLVDRERSVGELISLIGVEASSLSQHLAVVKRTGMVESRREGNSVTYRVTDASVETFLSAARAVLAVTLARSGETLNQLREAR